MSFSHGTAGKARRRFAFPGLLTAQFGLAAATVGTSEEIINTYTLPKGALDKTGQGLRVLAHFTTATNANTKVAKVRINGIGGTVLVTLTTGANGLSLVLEATFRRVSATTVSGFSVATVSAVAPTFGLLSAVTTANLDTADQTIVVTGTTGSGAGDLTLRNFQIELLPETPSPADA